MRARLAASIAFSTILLASCASIPYSAPTAAPNATFTTAPLPAELPSDLPRIARPLHYAITIEPDAQALTFSGQSSVTLELFEPSDALVLHALELDISEAVLVAADGTRMPLSVSYQPEMQTAQFTAAEMLLPGTYRLETRYTGRIGTQAVGLFALDYPDKRTGEQVRGLFTQFEAPDARRFAPMFDEPSYKATFDLSAIVPAAQMAVGNMPITAEHDLGNGRKQVTFATSPKMSSYLLFLAVGDFERTSGRAADGTEIGIVAPTGSGEQARFALDSTIPIIPWLEDYFGAAYPLPKLDNVAAPGQSQFFGAMENWGAILTFESILLDDPAITSPARRQQIYTTLAHEVSHQWFGNIVTMAWWDDLWLNEGFASWLENKITHQFYPEWQANLTRVDVRERAMGLDAYANTHPVISEVRTVAELAQAFDGIAYSKGESVIAMLESYAGEQMWQDGLRRYIARHAYANTSSADLWRAMEEAGASGLTDIAHDFTTQQGVPLVFADGACVNGRTMIALSQSEFSLDRRAEVVASPQAWRVPLWIAAGQGSPEVQVLEGRGSAAIDGCADPVLINAGQAGYFRTLYSDELAARQQAKFASLAPIDQLGLIRDGFALAQADYQPLARAMEEAGASGLTDIALDFTTQQGVPLVFADGACVNGRTIIALSQSEFSLDRRAEVVASPQAWRVPLWIAAGQSAPEVQVLEGSGSAAVDGCADPVLINAGQAGYFRTLYSDELAARQQAGFASLAPIDQLGLIRDGFALAQADYQPLARAMDLLAAVPADANPMVTQLAADTWAEQYETLGEDRVAERALLAALAQAALAPRLAALGFDPVEGEPVVDTNLRVTLIGALGRLGDERVDAEARRRFALLADDPRALDGPLKTTWLGIASAGADTAEWELLARLAAESTSTAERQSYYLALGGARDPALAERALEFALTGEAGTTSAGIIAGVSGRHPELAFDFASTRVDAVRALVDPSGWHDYLARLASGSRDPALLARLDEIRAGLPDDAAVSYTRVIDTMRVRLESTPRAEQALLGWLAKRG